MRKLWLIPFNLLFLAVFAYAADEVTITTYYPSPYGSYRELSWGNYPNTRGCLKADQGASLKLGGSGTPYIDFSNKMTGDYDARITLAGDNELSFLGITRLNVCVRVPYVVGVPTTCPACYYVSSFSAAPSGDMICCMISNPGGGC